MSAGANAIEVIVFAEGPSDELFLKRVVAPSLRAQGIFLKPQTLPTSRDGAGGAINTDRLKRNVRNTLRQSARSYLTTFFDLYALAPSMPGVAEAMRLEHPADKARHIERELHAELVNHTGCRPERLFPHVQPYELEGLFFSDTSAMTRVVPGWGAASAALQAVRASFDSPEHINNSFDTKPSARLDSLLIPRYRKTTHAPLIGERIGLPQIMSECPHFAAWVARLQALAAL